MNIKQLRTLLAVINNGSFASAGDELGLSHSAVSLQIKALEDELGVALFDRVTRPAVPSARGRALAEHAERTLALFDASAAVARGERVRRKVRIGAVPTVLSSFLPASLRRIQDRFPELQIELSNAGSATLAGFVAEGQLDMAICTKPRSPIPGLDWHPVATEPFVVIAPKSARGEDWRTLLQNERFIWFNRKTWAGQSIEEELRAKRVEVSAAMEIDSLEAITNLVSEGLGVAIVPLCRGKRPFSDRTRHVPFGDPPFSREVGVITPAGASGDLVIGGCIEALMED